MPTCDSLLEFRQKDFLNQDVCPSRIFSHNLFLLPKGSWFIKEFQYPDVLTNKVSETDYCEKDLVLHVFKMKLGK